VFLLRFQLLRLTPANNHQQVRERLVAVREATHAGHDAEHVVVERVDAYLRRAGANNRVERNRELERGLVNAREVARAGRLVLLGAQGERVDVNTRGRGAAVVLVRLHLVEVGALTLREAVLAVELQLGNLHGVLALAAHVGGKDDLREEVVDARVELGNASKILGVRTDQRGALRSDLAQHSRGQLSRRRVGSNGAAYRTRVRLGEQRRDHAVRREVVGVVEGLGTANRREPRGRRAVNERVALDDPLELLNGVVKVQLDLVGRRRDRLSTRVLDLLNQVLVRLLGEAAALLRVEVDVVNVDRGSGQGLGSNCGRHTDSRLGVLAVLPRLEVHIDAHLVVLERNEGDRHTRVAAEPELEGDVQRLGRAAVAGYARDRRFGRRAGRIERQARGALQQHEVVRVAQHGVQYGDVTGIRRQLRPDLHPVAVLAVNALTTDLELNLVDQAVADVVEPAETSTRRRQARRARG